METAPEVFWKAFVHAIICAVCPTWVLLFLPLLFALMVGSAEAFIIILSLPIMFAVPLTLVAMLCVLLPLTFLLEVLKVEREGIYVAVGGLTGLILPLAGYLILEDVADWAVLLPVGMITGPFAGMECFSMWASYRVSLTRATQREAPPANRIDDPRILR